MIRNKKGFTAIELIGTVAIIGLLSSMAVPSVNNVILQYRLKQTAREIASNLKLLRIRAISTNYPTYLDFTPEGNLEKRSYTAFVDEIENGNHDFPTETDATNLLLQDDVGNYKGKRLPSGVHYGWGISVDENTQGEELPADGISFTGDRAKFNPNGLGKPGAIYLKNILDESYAITVAITGRVKIWKWYGDNWK